jgi:hypothetical protein
MNLALILQGRPEALPLNPIARWEWVFPVVESFHICGFALLVGTVVILDLRLMGLIFSSQSVSRVAGQLARWIRYGLILTLITGPYLFSSDPREYNQVAAFRGKMILLALALLFHFTVIRKATSPSLDGEPLGWRRVGGGVSIALWTGVILGGLWIGNL